MIECAALIKNQTRLWKDARAFVSVDEIDLYKDPDEHGIFFEDLLSDFEFHSQNLPTLGTLERLTPLRMIEHRPPMWRVDILVDPPPLESHEPKTFEAWVRAESVENGFKTFVEPLRLWTPLVPGSSGIHMPSRLRGGDHVANVCGSWDGLVYNIEYDGDIPAGIYEITGHDWTSGFRPRIVGDAPIRMLEDDGFVSLWEVDKYGLEAPIDNVHTYIVEAFSGGEIPLAYLTHPTVDENHLPIEGKVYAAYDESWKKFGYPKRQLKRLNPHIHSSGQFRRGEYVLGCRDLPT